MIIVKEIFSSDVFWTIVGGVIVFILCQVCVEVWLRPLQYYKQLRRTIAAMLVEYASYYSNPLQLASQNTQEICDEYKKVGEKTRQLASELKGFIETMSWLHIGIPSKDKVNKASMEMIGLSNRLHQKNNVRNDHSTSEMNALAVRRIKTYLKIYGYDKSRYI